jgi:hypothetical protein
MDNLQKGTYVSESFLSSHWHVSQVGEGQASVETEIPFYTDYIGKEVFLHASSNDNALYFALSLSPYNEDKQRGPAHSEYSQMSWIYQPTAT